MSAEDILKLVKAGYTRAEIDAMGAEAPSNEANMENNIDEADNKHPDQKEASASQPAHGINMSEEQFTKLMQSINLNNATADIPPNKDINSILGDHYKSLILGK